MQSDLLRFAVLAGFSKPARAAHGLKSVSEDLVAEVLKTLRAPEPAGQLPLPTRQSPGFSGFPLADGAGQGPVAAGGFDHAAAGDGPLCNLEFGTGRTGGQREDQRQRRGGGEVLQFSIHGVLHLGRTERGLSTH